MAAPLLLNPQVIGAGIGAIGSLASTFLGGSMNQQAMRQQVEASKDLMNYEWENFKSPIAQVNALAAAGINPSVALGQGGSGFSATPSPSMPNSIPPQVGGIMDIANFVKAMSEAKKAGLESTAQELENQFNSDTLSTRIAQVTANYDYTNEQRMKVIQEWQKISQEVKNLNLENDIKSIDLSKHEKLVDSLIDTQVQRANLDAQQAKQLKEQLPLIVEKLKAENRVLSVDADIAESFKGTMANLGIVGQAVQILAKLVSIFK